LYTSLGFTSFRDYFQNQEINKIWGFHRANAYKLIDAYTLSLDLGDNPNLPNHASVLRPLRQIPKSMRGQVWKLAFQLATAADVPITRSFVEGVVRGGAELRIKKV
jgi:hypothetical protein